MKVFFDEDMGKNIPKALRSVRVPAERIEYPRSHVEAPVRTGTKDPDWIPWAGANGFVVISYNYRMLENPVELDLLMQHKVGVFYVRDAQVEMWQILGLLASRWKWIADTAETVSRPFCYLLGLQRAPERYDLNSGPRALRTLRTDERASRHETDQASAIPGMQLNLFP